MNRAIGSKVKLWDVSNAEVAEFRSYIDDIWNTDTVRKLDEYEQHHKTSRLQHCLNVSYYSFKIAKK